MNKNTNGLRRKTHRNLKVVAMITGYSHDHVRRVAINKSENELISAVIAEVQDLDSTDLDAINQLRDKYNPQSKRA